MHMSQSGMPTYLTHLHYKIISFPKRRRGRHYRFVSVYVQYSVTPPWELSFDPNGMCATRSRECVGEQRGTNGGSTQSSPLTSFTNHRIRILILLCHQDTNQWRYTMFSHFACILFTDLHLLYALDSNFFFANSSTTFILFFLFQSTRHPFCFSPMLF